MITREEGPPTHREWDEMLGRLHVLEAVKDLPAEVILATNIRRLLEDILEVGTIPTKIKWGFHFGARAKALLFHWNKRIVQEEIAVLGPYLNYGTAP